MIFFVFPSLSLGCCQNEFILQIISELESADSITHEIVETMQQLMALYVSFSLVIYSAS